ncbi:MAG: DNA-directed RNA polymerase subunit beta [Candidatus Kerfeldbacteria bacterium RIFOXYA2_FULL_38_24]|uniref:DNA-directed RNA polymerase subunit beta n=1 Tax=Candidatus Kerfeldbacteria bacterium RIFOXYB2_FULL_38_14 TaxID=1798547 RepID=A0A1G2BF32_9BACT|nr:MAG: DNA-directed RNA polymerase subunit beta [Candidatus Kerfeldbacteria bacterium RIFOXYB2_FULL_38_14]OGY87844.1 MAG: DNA-directed RNA polymerase subunit beta [Candidatus Kerfeldbacteria bacterium RIFOXYA2_FULL_38_24]
MKKSHEVRKYFTSSRDAIELPDLIEVQKTSYRWFMENGLQELFEEISPIEDFTGRDLELYFDKYYLDEPRFDEVTAKDKNLTFEAALRVQTRLVNKRTNEVKEQEVFLGDFPLMTDRGTFLVNGIERVVVSQLIRSAGVFFTSNFLKGNMYYGAKIIPNRGAWLEIETNHDNVIYVKVDRKRKVAVTALLRAFGYGTDEELIDLFKDVDIDPNNQYIKATIEKDIAKSEGEGLKEVYKRIRPGDMATIDNARSLIHSMFFNFDRYDFGRVGRYKINKRFGFDIENKPENRVLRREDLVAIIREVIRLNISQEEPDDIDHLGNRRVRAVGELVQNKFRIGLARMERIVKDRMSTKDVETLTPGQLINARPVIGAVKEFFMSSQLSQFMDQTNPLAELEHKRRLSAMGPGGLSRERAGFEVRDVHRSHYGRICPIATPEGPNIGLVGHLASFARINDFGFIETPFRKVIKESGKKPRVSDEVAYLDAFTEEKITTTSATTPLDENGYFLTEKVEGRKNMQPMIVESSEVDYMDVSPKQIVSISTALIPFLEHDDAVRALMGTNMQRQAVPTIFPQAPIVGTGVEHRAAKDSGQAVVSTSAGVIAHVQADKVVVKEKSGATKEYMLRRFVRSNASTSINQRPIVDKGQKIDKGEVIADGASTDHGELALGQNVLAAYMPWEGGNYEDAILLSERLVMHDRYTNVHIEDYTIDVRDTKLGPEIVTRDIPNVSEEKLKNLDEDGIIRIGAQVASGDILVGKITPKGETELSAEEKLLRAIFGEKAKDVKDSSLYLSHGEHGKVVDVKIFTKEAGDKLPAGVTKSIQVSIAQLRKVQVGDKMAGRHGNKGVISRIVPVEDMPYLADGTPVDIILNPLGIVSRMNLGQVLEAHLGMAAHALGYKVATPVFNGVSAETIRQELEKAGFPKSGKLILHDGRNGDVFDGPVMCGYAYMLKLNHMVEDKIHQRSIGPYSLVTQQPLGGKAQFGGQRFGEMEVWALEAYGAAHTLQEMLTIKSDDVPGRSKAYEATIKGEEIDKLNVPESFNVLIRELKGLGLDVELLDDNGSVVDISFKNRKRNQSAREANNQYSENEGVIDATTAKK